MTIYSESRKEGIKLYAKEATHFYISHSSSLNLCKLGVTKEPEHRMGNFNRKQPGGASDWIMLYYIKLGKERAAKFETTAGQLINSQRRLTDYANPNKNGEKYCREIFTGLPCELVKKFSPLAAEYDAHFVKLDPRVQAMREFLKWPPKPMTKGLFNKGDGLKPIAFRIYEEFGVLPEISPIDKADLQFIGV